MEEETKEEKKVNKKIIALMSVSLLVGLLIGYIIGFSGGLLWAFDKAMVLLDKQGIKIAFDENMLRAGLFQYQNNVGGCLFVDAINKTG